MSVKGKSTVKKTIAAGCLTCIVALVATGVMIQFYYIPKYEYQQRVRVCWMNRRHILDQEELFKQHSPTHQYTTKLQKLSLTVPYNICPDDGVYSVVIKNDHIQVNCSIKEHNTTAAK